MNLLGSILEECPHVILQLRAAYDRVIAEHHALVLQDSRVRNQFHLGHQCTTLLITRCKRTGPCRGVFQDGTLIGHPLTVGITQGHTDTRVRHATDAVNLRCVLLTHHLTVTLANSLYVDTVIVRSGESVVHPQERTDLLTLQRLLQHLHLVGCQEDNLTRTQVLHAMEVQIRETRRLTRYSVGPLFLADDNGGAAQEVTGGNQAFLRHDQHRARAIYLTVNQVNTFHERAPHINQQCYKLRLVDGVGRILTEVHPAVEQLLGNLFHIVDLGHGHYRETPQVRVHQNRLRIGITDHTDTLITRKRVELILELRAEIVALQVMNLTTEALLLVKHHHTCTLRSEVRVIVCAIKEVVYTTFRRNGSKESSHCYPFLFTVYSLRFTVDYLCGYFGVQSYHL